MSLACFECKQIGFFVRPLILFERKGSFDPQKPVSHYHNFYTGCATFDDLGEAVKSSRFMVVELCHNQSGGEDKIEETKHKLVDEEVLAKKLPKTFKALLKAGK